MTEAHSELQPSNRLRRWLKWLPVALLLALLLGRVLLGYRADNQLQALIDGARAQGEPATPDDLQKPPIADDQNAAVLIRQALDAYHLTPEQRSDDEAIRAKEADDYWSSDRLKWYQGVIAENRQALDLLGQARRLPLADWQPTPRNLSETVAPNTPPHRSLANLLAVQARLKAEAGDVAGAADALLALMTYARQVDQQRMLVPHLVANEIDAIAADTLLDLCQKPIALSDHVAATLTARLLDDDARLRGFRDAMLTERALVTQETLRLANAGGWVRIFRPMVVNDAGRAFKRFTLITLAVTAASWPAAEALLPRESNLTEGLSLKRISRLMSDMFATGINRSAKSEFWRMADRRAAAVALAIARYRRDHDGAFPQNLAALVPKYLVKIPFDPMSAVERELSFLPQRPNPILYSVGANGTDEGGSEKRIVRGRGDEWDDQDRVYHLTAPAPATAPSTQAASEAS
ncbi:MAG TPA: hypothetical protein VF669_12695 [Tepidisphaeraceae bacterium]